MNMDVLNVCKAVRRRVRFTTSGHTDEKGGILGYSMGLANEGMPIIKRPRLMAAGGHRWQRIKFHFAPIRKGILTTVRYRAKMKQIHSVPNFLVGGIQYAGL